MYAYACVSSLSELNMTCYHFIWPTWQAFRLSVSVSTLLFLSTPVPLGAYVGSRHFRHCALYSNNR